MWRIDLLTSFAAVTWPPCLIRVAGPSALSLTFHFHSWEHKTKRSLVTLGSVTETSQSLRLQNSNTIKTDEPILSIWNTIKLSECNKVMPVITKLIKSVNLSPVTMIVLMWSWNQGCQLSRQGQTPSILLQSAPFHGSHF